MSITQRIDAITLVKQDRFKEVLPAPKSVKIELTGRCNYRCGFCALREPLPCWSAFTEGHVTADGYLSACCFDADGRWRMGDLKRQSFMEAWNSPEFIALRRAHLRKDVAGTPCEECVAYA